MNSLLYILCILFFFGCQESPSVSPIDSTRDVVLTIDMSSQESFIPSEDTLTVHIISVGEFDMGCDAFDCSVTVPALIVGKSYEYIYSVNDIEEGLISNRVFTVGNETNIFSDYVFGQLNPAVLIFRVDMSYQIEIGSFDPSSQSINLVGDINGWAGSEMEAMSSDPGKYETVVTDVVVGESIQYKCRIDDSGWEAPDPNISECVDDTFGGYNRIHSIQQEERVLDWWFSDLEGN